MLSGPSFAFGDGSSKGATRCLPGGLAWNDASSGSGANRRTAEKACKREEMKADY